MTWRTGVQRTDEAVRPLVKDEDLLRTELPHPRDPYALSRLLETLGTSDEQELGAAISADRPQLRRQRVARPGLGDFAELCEVHAQEQRP